MTPLVSICVPNFNTFPFLAERFDTIFGQTLRDWELLVYDSYSDDGSWELIERLVHSEPRMRCVQGPRLGPYPAWNECLRHARGKYVYVATSDDTMAADCLEKMAAALERHPDCDMAHCQLTVIDETGAPIADHSAIQESLFRRSAPQLVDRHHIRRAPYDGLLCLTGEHVYYSITEKLIRRSLFDRLGGFESRWGSPSDFHWHMRVGLVSNTVHVPDTWASWRIHPGQATASAGVNTREYTRKIEEMIQDAVRVCERHLSPVILSGLKSHWLDWTREMRAYYSELRHRHAAFDRRVFQLSQVVNGPAPARSEVGRRLLGKPKWGDVAPIQMRVWLESVGYLPVACIPDGQIP